MKRLLFVALLGGLLLPLTSDAQCNSYSKRKCKPELDPYTSVQISTTVLRPGDEAEVMLTFYQGQSYRLLVCSQEQLGDVGFKLYDTDEALIFESEENTEAKVFDFEVASTTQLILTVNVPMDAQAAHGITVEGCISVLIGSTER